MKCSTHDKHSTLIKGVNYLGHKYMQVIYDWSKYIDPTSHTWCPANDVVSQNIDLYGFWEVYETALMNDLFKKADKGSNFIDVGAQTGWYTLLAADSGLNVLAVESDENSASLIKGSVSMNGFENVVVSNLFVDDKSNVLPAMDMYLVKVDVEGNEKYALKMFEDSFEQKLIKYAVFEFSPVFNDSYKEILEKLNAYGYNGYKIPTGEEFWANDFLENPLETLLQKQPVVASDIDNWEQENILFKLGETE